MRHNHALRAILLFDDADEIVYENRIYRERINFNLPTTTFREAFRVDKPIVEDLENRIGFRIDRLTDRSHALSVREQILITLHFLGNGSFYHINGHVHGIDKGTICRTVHRVCFLIAKYLMPLFIRWPTDSRNISRKFQRIAGFPHVKGLIDGTLIRIDAPSVDEPVYVGRDHRHSFNVVVVSGPHYEFFFISAKCGGSFHDSRVLQSSNLWAKWELQGWRPDGDRHSIILGDSAYPLRSWLMTPNIRNVHFNNPNLARGVRRYLAKHRKTRFMVECAIGIFKEQFPCLNQLRVRSPERISYIIYACATLHNMQNNYRHGSYAYDAILNEIANRDAEDDVLNAQIPLNEDEEALNEMDGIDRQLELLEFFQHQ